MNRADSVPGGTMNGSNHQDQLVPGGSTSDDSHLESRFSKTYGSSSPINGAAEGGDIHEMTIEESIPEEFTKNYYFGCGSVAPSCLQVLARKKFFTFLLCLFICCHSGVVSGVISVIVSTIERRYSFSSVAAGFIFVVYDVAVGAGVIFAGYFATNLHKPRVLGINCLILTVSCIMFASPQFLLGFDVPTNSDNSHTDELCSYDSTPSNKSIDTECTSADDAAYAIFVLSSIVLAIPATFIYTIGFTYIDDIVFPKHVSLHFGVVNIFAVVGPAVGFGIGSGSLSVYVNPWEEPSGLDTSDPAFVGAWWIPFLVMGTVSSVLSVPFLMYPRWLPDSYQVRVERQKELTVKQQLHTDESSSLATKYGSTDKAHRSTAGSRVWNRVKQLPVNILRLMKNPSLMCAAFGLSFFYVFFQGFISFGPKLIEVEFHVTPTIAGLTTGALGIVGAFVGVSGGAIIIYCLKAAGKKNAMVIILILSLMLPFMLGFFLHCPSIELAGVLTPYEDGAISGIDSSSCSSNCSCVSNVFNPVCGSDSITYFSPCRAGCTQQSMDSEEEYMNCSCVSMISNYTTSTYSIMAAGQNYSTAVKGTCQSTCALMAPALFMLLCLVIIAFFIAIPYQHFIVRVVADDQRAIALGFQSTIWRFCGALPGPPLFGLIFDLACELWQEECDGSRGNCWVYNHSRLTYYVAAFAYPCQICGTILFICAFLTFPKRDDKVRARSS